MLANRLSRRLRICFLALAVLLGQQAAHLHALSHAIESVHPEDSRGHPGPDHCDKCTAYAPFGAAATSFHVPPPVADGAVPAPPPAFLPAVSRTFVSSRSRAPPVFA